MRLFFTNRFKKLYKKLPEPIKKKVNRQLHLLAEDLRHPAIRARKMVGRADLWQGRVDDNYRFTFQIAGDTIFLRSVGLHDILKKR